MAHAGRVSTAQALSDGEFATRTLGYVWDPIALNYILAVPGVGGGGGGGGPVTVLNGADVAEGATTDLEAAAGNGSVIAILKRIRTLLSGTLLVDASTAVLQVDINSGAVPGNSDGAAIPVPFGTPIMWKDAGGNLRVVTDAKPLPINLAALGIGQVPVTDNAGSLTTDTPQLPLALAGGKLDVNIGSAISLPGTVVDGGDVAQGAKADAVWDGVTVSTTISAVMKYIGQKVEAARALLAGTLRFAKREIGYANLAMYAEAVAGIIAETAITINLSRAFGAPAAATSNGAAAAKELVITGIIISWVSTSTTANTARIRIRVNPAGAAIITSPIAFSMRISWESATFIANEGELQPFFFPEPIVIPNPGQFMATIACVAANGTLDIQLLGYERTP